MLVEGNHDKYSIMIIPNILPGTSIHGMSLLMSTNGSPSLQDLKRYDPCSGWPEVSYMKTLAHQRPGSSFTEKALCANDFQLWWAESDELRLLWKSIRLEQHDDKLVFVIERKQAAEYGIVKNPYDLLRLMEDQKDFAHIFAPCNDPVKDLIVGWVKFTQVSNDVVVTEIQSQLESKRKYAWDRNYQIYQAATVTSIVLTEAIRFWINKGINQIVVVTSQEKRLHGQKVPHDVYSRMLRRNGLCYCKATRVWKFIQKDFG